MRSLNRSPYAIPACLCAFAFSAAAQPGSEIYQGREVRGQQVIVKLLPGASLNYSQASAAHDLDRITPLGGRPGLFLFHSRSNNVAALLQQVAGRPDITYVEPNHVIRAENVPNDPSFSQLWGLLNAGKPGADIGAASAWDVSTGSTANVAGVVDTGVDYTHPDLAANMWSAPWAFTVTIAGNSITCAAGTHGFNAIANTCDPMDDNSHGTHVSGTIGAVGNNGAGVAGVNWTARIMGLKFMGANGAGDVANAVNCIEFALQAKAQFGASANLRVLSNSWGGTGYSQTLLDEINKANANDVLFVAAAGNTATNVDGAPFYPAAYATPNMIAVAATDSNDGLASFSNFGSQTVHLGAPGVGIVSTIPGAAYASYSGTSMATPHVAGAALLVLSHCALSTASLKSNLLNNADWLAALAGNTITGGRLNVGRAIHACAGAGLSAVAVSPSVIASGQSAVATVSLTSSAGPGGAWIALSSSNPAAAGVPATITIPQGAASGSFTIGAGSVNSATAVTIGAYYAGGSAAATLTVNPPAAPPPPPPVTGTASFIGFDAATQGNWKSKYGAEGYTVVGDSAVNPGYVTPLPAGQGQWVWAASTADPRALQKASLADRLASGWYTNSSFTVDLNFGGQGAHQVAVYCLDWDNYGPRAQRLDILDANGNVLDSRPLASFYSGQYLVWNLSGHVKIRVTDLAGNALINGIFFGGPLAAPPPPPPPPTPAPTPTPTPTPGPPSGTSAVFLNADTATQGNWNWKYGIEGYTVIGDAAVNPGYVTPVPSGQSQWTWAASTSDPRGLQKLTASDRIAAGWYTGGSFTIDLNFNDAATHQVAIYCVDWDNYGPRAETVDVLDANNNVLDTRALSSFYGGVYLVWNMSGHVRLRVTDLRGNALVNGIFFGGNTAVQPPAGSSATFVAADSATQGNWRSKYGAEGYTLVGDSAANPSYVTPVPAGQSQWTWAASTGDGRALAKANAADRLAAGWYTGGSFTIDLNFTDQAAHQVAIYCLDWDNYGPRSQKVEALDANGNVLDTRTMTGFYGGEYLVWNMRGHVKLRVTNLWSNAVVNGIFFGASSPAPPPPQPTGPGAQFVTADAATQGNWNWRYGQDGYTLVGDSAVNPSYVTPAVSGQSPWTWAASTSDGRALLKANGSDRLAAGWYTGSALTIDLNISGPGARQVAIYCLDWDNYGPRSQKVEVLDPSGNVLDTRSLTDFTGGVYLVWNLTGHVILRVTNLWSNAVVNGIFFR